MLEVGKSYKITILEESPGEGLVEGTYRGTVVEAEWPMVRLDDGRVINLTSPRFVKAEPQ